MKKSFTRQRTTFRLLPDLSKPFQTIDIFRQDVRSSGWQRFPQQSGPIQSNPDQSRPKIFYDTSLPAVLYLRSAPASRWTQLSEANREMRFSGTAEMAILGHLAHWRRGRGAVTRESQVSIKVESRFDQSRIKVESKLKPQQSKLIKVNQG
jgi:hypothetical protein